MEEVQVSFVFLPFSICSSVSFPLSQRLESRKGSRDEGRKKGGGVTPARNEDAQLEAAI